MKRLLLDVDGVIADFLKATEWGMMRLYGLKPAREWTEWDIIKMDWIYYLHNSPCGVRDGYLEMLGELWNREGFCYGIPAYDGAIEQVKQLAEVFDVYFVTSPMVTSKTWVYERSQWLVKHFGPELGKKVIHTHYKELIDGAIFVDDKPQHVEDWRLAQFERDSFTYYGVACIMDRAYNQSASNDGLNYRRIKTLTELLAYQ